MLVFEKSFVFAETGPFAEDHGGRSRPALRGFSEEAVTGSPGVVSGALIHQVWQRDRRNNVPRMCVCVCCARDTCAPEVKRDEVALEEEEEQRCRVLHTD